MYGTIFNIQSFSLHDGPGIRTTVFFKGCPLKCLWCHNPESHRAAQELLFYTERCTGCGKCVRVCPEGGVTLIDGRAVTDRKKCIGCGHCVTVCPAGAREISGKMVTVEEVMEVIEKDRMFYESSGGGVTLSGGEPLLYGDFIRSLMEQCRDAGIHTAVETSGYADSGIVKKALEPADLILFDFKAADSRLHRRLTGVPNEKILENARILCRGMKKKMVIRIPVVPGGNDGEDNIRASADFIHHRLDLGIPVHLLPYHDLGTAKEERLEWEKIQDFKVPEQTHMEQIKKWMEEYDLTVQIGGSM